MNLYYYAELEIHQIRQRVSLKCVLLDQVRSYTCKFNFEGNEITLTFKKIHEDYFIIDDESLAALFAQNFDELNSMLSKVEAYYDAITRYLFSMF